MFNRKRHKKKGIHHIQTNRFIENVNTKNAFKCVSSWTTIQQIVKKKCYFLLYLSSSTVKSFVSQGFILFKRMKWMHDMKWERNEIFLFFNLIFSSFVSLFTSFTNLFILSYEKTPIVILFWFYNFGNNLIFIAPLWFILDIEYLFSFLSSKSSQTNAIFDRLFNPHTTKIDSIKIKNYFTHRF